MCENSTTEVYSPCGQASLAKLQSHQLFHHRDNFFPKFYIHTEEPILGTYDKRKN